MFYGVAYVVGAALIPIFTFGRYTVEPWNLQKRGKAKKRATHLGLRIVSEDLAAGVGFATLLAAALIGYFLWRAAGA